MVDHPTETTDEAQGDDGMVSSDQAAAASTDDKTVPLGEAIKHRQAASEAKKASEAANKRVAELEAQLEKLKGQAKAKVAEQPRSTESDDLAARLGRIERQETLRNLMVEHGLDAKQADAVHTVMQELPGLSDNEARLIAAQRDPTTFAEGASTAGYDPGVHGSSRPMPGNAPTQEQQSDYEDRLNYAGELIAKGGDKKLANRILNNLVGRIAARQVGKPGHEMIPLPRQQ